MPEKKKKGLWLTRERDSQRCLSYYYVHGDEPYKVARGNGLYGWSASYMSFCPDTWNKETSKELHLKPGSGPIPIKIVLDTSRLKRSKKKCIRCKAIKKKVRKA